MLEMLSVGQRVSICNTHGKTVAEKVSEKSCPRNVVSKKMYKMEGKFRATRSGFNDDMKTLCFDSRETKLCVISGLRCEEDEKYTLLGYYAAWNGNSEERSSYEQLNDSCD